MIKQPYELVRKEVDKMFDKAFDENDDEGIFNHIEFIETYIKACGYSVQEYTELMCELPSTCHAN